MNYEVQLSRTVELKVKGWGLPAPLLITLFERVNAELAADPSRYVREVRDYGLLQYAVTVEDCDPIPGKHLFLFHLKYSPENVLQVHNINHIDLKAMEEVLSEEWSRQPPLPVE